MELIVKITTEPKVLSFPSAEKQSGRKRVQLENMINLDNLDHAFIYPDIGRKGVKVIIANKKWDDFIKYCDLNPLNNA